VDSSLPPSRSPRQRPHKSVVVAGQSRTEAELQGVAQKKLQIAQQQAAGQISQTAKVTIETDMGQADRPGQSPWSRARSFAGHRTRVRRSPSRFRRWPTATGSSTARPRRVYRDSEGRTRTEEINANGEVASVSISDPVQGTSYILNPQNRTAYQSGVIVTSSTAGGV